jgi:hypothetical protein
MTVSIQEEAGREFMADASYYEDQEVGLGHRFRCEVADVVNWIARNPEVPRLRGRRYRRVNLRTFPHYVAYVIRDDQIWVVAVSHAFRLPEHWISRL